jgi:thiol:disulfide interchange protein DsbD
MKWLFLLVLFAGPLNTFAQQGKDLVKVQLVTDVREVKAGEPFHVGLRLKIKEGWHIYWKNPGDSGAPTKAALRLPEGFKADDWQFPVPSAIKDPGGTVYGYTDEVMLIAKVTPPATMSGTAAGEISCDANWLVCEKMCLMGKGSAKLSLPAKDEKALIEKWLARVPQPAGERAQVTIKSSGEGTSQMFQGVIRVKSLVAEKVEWFPGPSETISTKDVNISAHDDVVEVSFQAERIGDPKAAAGQMESVVAYTLGDGSRAGVTVPISFASATALAK